MAGGTQSRGGGVMIALGAMGGAIAGGLANQPSIGLVAGTAIGVAGALALWLRDRARADR